MGCVVDRSIRPIEIVTRSRSDRRQQEVSVTLASSSTLRILEEINELPTGSYAVVEPKTIEYVGNMSAQQVADELEYPRRIKRKHVFVREYQR